MRSHISYAYFYLCVRDRNANDHIAQHADARRPDRDARGARQRLARIGSVRAGEAGSEDDQPTRRRPGRVACGPRNSKRRPVTI